MRDLSEQHTILFKINPDEAIDRVQVALDFLWRDKEKAFMTKLLAISIMKNSLRLY